MKRKINILDTTLRDGSYAINYRFTAADTENLCRRLEKAGIEYIEIGHGVGLNGSANFGKASETDEEYMIAARKGLTTAKFGMFCIPGIARLEDINLAKKHKMGFIRVGVNVDKVKDTEPFIKKSKQAGMFVAVNLMKSYATPPEEFAKLIVQIERYGADMAYIVDSAGGMLPEQLLSYITETKKRTDIPLGFHGHDNLCLAVSNSLTAIDNGVDFVDCSLQGLGRSAGNAGTETVVAALMKKGYKLDIDFLALLELGREYVQPLIPHTGRMPLDIVSGYADFHSSYMPLVGKIASKHNINPAKLIIELCKVDKINADPKLLEEIASKIKSEDDFSIAKFRFDKYVGGEQNGKP